MEKLLQIKIQLVIYIEYNNFILTRVEIYDLLPLVGCTLIIHCISYTVYNICIFNDLD